MKRKTRIVAVVLLIAVGGAVAATAAAKSRTVQRVTDPATGLIRATK